MLPKCSINLLACVKARKGLVDVEGLALLKYLYCHTFRECACHLNLAKPQIKQPFFFQSYGIKQEW